MKFLFNAHLWALTIITVLLSACISTQTKVASPTPDSALIAPVVDDYRPMPIDLPSELVDLPIETTPVVPTTPPPPTYPKRGVLSERAIVKFNDAELKCMATAIYFESKGEGPLGMQAVGYVILNRMGHKEFPNSACSVVYQRSRKGCQFSWVCDGKPDTIKYPALYRQSKEAAVSVLNRSVANPIGESIFFRHKSLGSGKQRLTHQIGNHRFFVKS